MEYVLVLQKEGEVVIMILKRELCYQHNSPNKIMLRMISYFLLLINYSIASQKQMSSLFFSIIFHVSQQGKGVHSEKEH